MSNILVSGYIGFNNFGDEAIFYALSNHLKSLGYDISVLCTNTQETKEKYQVSTYHYKKPLEIIKAILKCDLLISGGGSLLQNKTSNFSLYYYLFIIFLAKLFKKKVLIFAQGIEPIIGEKQTELTKKILKKVDFITLRDQKSVDLLSSWNIKASLVSDPAYSLVQDKKINKHKKGLLIQLRSFKGIDNKFISKLAEILAKNYDEKIKVFSLQDEYDEKICKNFCEKLRNLEKKVEYIPNKTIEETIEIFNKAKFVISTRLHGLIISTALNCNTFALCYDEKIKTISDELNISNIDFSNYSKEELEDKIKNFLTDNSEKNYNYRKFDWELIDNKIKEFLN